MPMRTVPFADSTSNKDRSIPPSRHVLHRHVSAFRRRTCAAENRACCRQGRPVATPRKLARCTRSGVAAT